MKILILLSLAAVLSGCAMFKSRGVYQNCSKVEGVDKEFACDRPLIGR